MTIEGDLNTDAGRSQVPWILAAWSFVVAGLALRELLLMHSFHFFVDDAYIFLRYAREAANGNGLVYNPGQHVMGFTSPLYVLILTGLGVTFGVSHLVGTSIVVEAALYLFTSGALIALGRRREASLPLLIIAWVLWFPLVAAAVNGMETMLFLTLMFGALILAIRNQHGAAAILAALAILTRPEGVLFAIVLVGACIHHRPIGRRSWPGLVLAAVLLLSWLAFAEAYYGSVIPQSIRAKDAAASAAGPLQSLAVVSLGFSSAQFNALSSVEQGAAVTLGILCLIVVVAALIVDFRRKAVAVAVPAWFVCTWLFYVIGRPVELWSWYSAPTTLALWWVIARHAPELLTWTAAQVTRRRRSTPVLAAVRCTSTRERRLFVSITGLAGLASLAIGVDKRSQSLESSVVGLRALAGYVHQVAPNATSLQIDDIGIVGWDSGDRIVDGAGLVSPIASEKVHGHLLSSAAIALRTHPDVVLLKANPASIPSAPHTRLLRPLYGDAAERAELLSDYRLTLIYGLGGYRVLLHRPN